MDFHFYFILSFFWWHIKQFSDTEIPVNDTQYGRYNPNNEQCCVHANDELVLCGHVLYHVLARQLTVLSQQDGGSVAGHPDQVHHQCAAQEIVLGVGHRQIQEESSRKVVEQVAIGDEDGDGPEDDDEGDGSSDTSEDDDVGEKGGHDENQGPGSEINQEDGKTE